jgi:hypothetical protein
MEQEKLKYAEPNGFLDVEKTIAWKTPVRTVVVGTDN